MEMIEPNGDVNSAVATLDGRRRKKKIPMKNTNTVHSGCIRWSIIGLPLLNI